ncbi:substrate-binding domain-containing protein [Pseudomonas sp. SDO524_S393]
MKNLFAGIVLAGMTWVAASAACADTKVMTTLPSFKEPFFVYMQKALKKAGQEQGMEIVEADGEGDSNTQSSHIDRAISIGVKGIIISPIDVKALGPAIQRAIDAGIPVVTIDRSVSGVHGLIGHVGADNVEGGREQGRWIARHFPDGARILNLRGRPGASAAIDRNKGLHEVLDADKKYRFVAEQTGNWLRDEAYNVTDAIYAGLDKKDYPDVIVSASDAMGFGVQEALEKYGVRMITPHITFDAAPATLDAVKLGTRGGGFAATIDQWPDQQSVLAVKMMADFLKDGTRPEKAVNLIAPGVIDGSAPAVVKQP